MIRMTHIDLPYTMNDGSSHGGIGHMGTQIEAWFVGPYIRIEMRNKSIVASINAADELHDIDHNLQNTIAAESTSMID